jgi:hypothetical protein
LERTFIDKRPALRLTARTPSHPRIVASLRGRAGHGAALRLRPPV